MQIRRKIFDKIAPLLDSKEIIVITGMRRVGKTTLLQMIYDSIDSTNKTFLDLENILEQKVFEETDFNNIWKNLKAYGLSNRQRAFVFLDEIQAMPQSVKAIKYLYDHYDIKFYLTGSSSFYLKNLFPESLAGRKHVFELFPLTFEEFLLFKQIKVKRYQDFDHKAKNKNRIAYEKVIKYYEEYLKFGGFPQVALTEDESEKKLLLKDIFTSYFEMDVRRLADFRHITAFRDMLLLLMQRVGSKLDISRISSEIGVSRETVYSYLAFLEGSYFISRISPFSRNADREVSGTRKIYFCDNGIINMFGNISAGALLENAVYMNIRQLGAVNYYQKRSGAEIDFVLPDHSLALEVKRTADERDVSRLERLCENLGLKNGYVISQKFSELSNCILAPDL